MRLLVVSPSTSYRIGAFLAAAEALGCQVVVATDADVAISGSAIVAPLHDVTDATEVVVAALARAGTTIDGVLGTDGSAVAVAAAVAERLGLRANDRSAVERAADKLAQRVACEAAGIRQPAFAVAGETTWGRFPAMVKPVDRAASQGVLRADDHGELAVARCTVERIAGPNRPVLVEEYIDGAEVAIEGLLSDGHLDTFAVFDKPDRPTGPTFPETLLVSPARIEPDVERRVIETVRAAAAAIGLQEGPVHGECLVVDGEACFLELAARSIGGLCSRALRPGGHVLEELLVRHALGLPLPDVDGRGSPTGVLMLPVPAAGRLLAVEGTTAASAVPGVTAVEVTIGPGQDVVPLPEGDRYLGFVFADGDSADAVETALREAWRCLRVEIA